MDLSTWLLFVGIALIATFSPGPAILLAITNSLSFGLRATCYSTLGNELGILFVSSITFLGLGTLLATSTSLFLILKTVGAGYLIYLGIRQWRAKNTFFSTVEKQQHAITQSNKQSFLQGFLIASTNPKAVLFFTALFPQFITLNESLILQFALLTATFTCLSACALISYGLLAQRSKKWLSNNKYTAYLNKLLGGIFIMLGIGLLQYRR
jgi:threonine/homoserine/homoserine lactone efflux protein